MIKFIKYFILFIVFSFIFYISALIFVGHFLPSYFDKNLNYKLAGYGHLYTRLQEVKIYGNVDVLVLGSSHAYRGFDTRIFNSNGLKVFNLGSSSQTPLQTKLLLDRYLNLLNPKLVIYEVYPGSFCADGVESAIDLVTNSEYGFDTFLMTVKLHNIKVFNTFLFAFYRQILDLNAGFIEERLKEKDFYIKGGYVEKQTEYLLRKETFGINEWKVNPNQFELFKSILETFKARDIKFVLIQAPITKELYNSYTNNHEIDLIFNELGQYYNFNHLMELSSDQYFYDSNHLNQNGVILFNKELINILQKDNYL